MIVRRWAERQSEMEVMRDMRGRPIAGDAMRCPPARRAWRRTCPGECAFSLWRYIVIGGACNM